MIVKTIIYCPEIIYSTNYLCFTSNVLAVWVLNSQSRVSRFKNTGWLQADSGFDPSFDNQVNIRNSWNLVTQRKLSPCSGSVSYRQLNHCFCPSNTILMRRGRVRGATSFENLPKFCGDKIIFSICEWINLYEGVKIVWVE